MLTTPPTTSTAVGAVLRASNEKTEAAPAVFITVQRFCHDRSLPRSSFYKAVKANQIKPTKRGRRTLIHADEAKRYDDSLLSAVS